MANRINTELCAAVSPEFFTAFLETREDAKLVEDPDTRMRIAMYAMGGEL